MRKICKMGQPYRLCLNALLLILVCSIACCTTREARVQEVLERCRESASSVRITACQGNPPESVTMPPGDTRLANIMTAIDDALSGSGDYAPPRDPCGVVIVFEHDDGSECTRIIVGGMTIQIGNERFKIDGPVITDVLEEEIGFGSVPPY